MKWDYSRHYARRHPNTPEHDANLRGIFQANIGPHLPAHKDLAWLDVGCGRGYALEWLRSLGYSNLTGVDADSEQVAFAVARGLSVTYVEDTVEFLQSRASTCEAVLLMDVLEHVAPSAQPPLLAAIHAALRPGGILLCTVPNAASPLASFWRFADYTHETLFTSESLEFLLTQMGFEISAILPMEFVPRPRWLFWPLNRQTFRWWALVLSRLPSRIAFLGETGWRHGWDMPLSPNLLVKAIRR